MRFTAALTLLVATSLSAIAKDPEPKSSRSRSQDVLDPDETKTLSFDSLRRSDVSAPTFQTGSAGTSTFHFEQKFQPKGYEAKSFKAKGWWGGDFKFSTNDARTKTFDTKAMPVKEAPVKTATDATKTSATRAYAAADKQAKPKGRTQAALDKLGQPTKGAPAVPPLSTSWTGNLDPLTVQDIKDLLNKNE